MNTTKKKKGSGIKSSRPIVKETRSVQQFQRPLSRAELYEREMEILDRREEKRLEQDRKLIECVKKGDFIGVRKAVFLQGARVTAKDEDGKTALRIADEKGYIGIAGFLSVRGARK